MNSKQTNFFLVPEDWPAISIFLKENNIAILKKPIMKIEDLFTPVKDEENQFNLIYLTKDEYRGKVILNPSKKGYYVDTDRSYVVEFDRGVFYQDSANVLHRGRLYSVSRYYDDNQSLVNKDSDFIEWVNDLFKLFKKNFLRKSSIDKYFLFSEGAIKWIQEHNAQIDTPGFTAFY